MALTGQSARDNATMTRDLTTFRRRIWDSARWRRVRIVLAGGSGSLGRRLASAATGRGGDVVVLTRAHREDLPHRQALWDGKTVGAWVDELNDAVLINLAGELVDRRPTASNIALLTRSRVEPTRALAAGPKPVRNAELMASYEALCIDHRLNEHDSPRSVSLVRVL